MKRLHKGLTRESALVISDNSWERRKKKEGKHFPSAILPGYGSTSSYLSIWISGRAITAVTGGRNNNWFGS